MSNLPMSSLTATRRQKMLSWSTFALGLTGALLLAVPPASAAEIYQWTDANGVVHYSDTPPPNGQYDSRMIQQSSGNAAPVTETPAAPAENANCSTAQSNLKMLNSDQSIGMDTDNDGKPDTTLTPEQRASQTKLAEAAIAVHCASAPDSGDAPGSDT